MRSTVPRLSVLALALFSIGASTDAIAFNFCNRHPVTFFPLVAELNRVYKCAQPLSCLGTAVDSEVKQIAGYADVTQWLVNTTNPNAAFSIAQQNAIISNTKNRAIAIKPPSKFILEVQFFQDVIVGSATSSLIGANVTYATCNKRPPPSHR